MFSRHTCPFDLVKKYIFDFQQQQNTIQINMFQIESNVYLVKPM